MTEIKNETLSSYDPNIVKGVRTCIEMNENILLIGETGTGKTTMLNELAKEKKKELIRVSLNGATSTDDILGKMLAKDGSTYWQNGILVDAMEQGHWIVFDEINACLPEVLFVLHSLLDDDKKVTLIEKHGEIIRPTGDFRFFACMNPSENYAGTKETNMALMSRFGGVFNVDVFPTHQELAVLKRNNVTEADATKLVNLASKLRDMRKKGDLYTFVSTRDIIQAGKLSAGGLGLPLAVEFSVLNKMTGDEREDLKKTTIMKDFLTGSSSFKSEEVQKLERVVRDETLARKKLEDALAVEKRAKEELKKELEELKKTKVGLTGIDPKKALLLKKLGIDVTGI